MAPVTLSRIKRELHKLDPAMRDEDDAFKAGVIMLSGLSQPLTVPALAKFTGYPRPFVSTVVHRLRSNGIFTRKGQVAADWFDQNDGGIAFFMDVNVALGFMQRSELAKSSAAVDPHVGSSSD